MKPRNGFFLTICLVFYNLSAQQVPQFSHFPFLSTYLNPSAAGLSGNMEAFAIMRYQWITYSPTNGGDNAAPFNGSPVSQIVSISTKIQSLNAGVGGMIVNDQLGPSQNTAARVMYAQHFDIEKSKLSVGIYVSPFMQSINSSLLRPNNAQDPTLDRLNQRQSNIDLGTGVMYLHPRFYVGLGLWHLLEPRLSNSLEEGSRLQRLVNLHGGYRFKLNDNFMLNPNILARLAGQGITTSYDLNLLLSYKNDIFWSGISFRRDDALIGLIGVSLLSNHSLKVGYAFDISVLGTAAKSGTSHEIYIAYSKKVADLLPKPIIRTPRFRY